MGFRFQRRIKIIPGVTLNVGKRGVSTSIGRRGAHITFGQNGVRTTAGIPGTEISYTSLSKPSRGAGMRKRWDRCPACHQVLEQPLPEMRCVAEGAGGCMRGICSVSARRVGAGFWIRRWKSCLS